MWALVTAPQSWHSTAISHLGAVSAVASGQPWPLNLCASPHHPRLQAVASEDMRVNACWLRAALEEFPATVPTAYQLADAFVGVSSGTVAGRHAWACLEDPGHGPFDVRMSCGSSAGLLHAGPL